MMYKRSIFAFLVFFLPCICLYAENDKRAEQIANNLIKKLESNSIRAEFKLTISEDKQAIDVQNGEFIMQKKKFCMLTESIQVFFDGKTQWTYIEENNEVNITEPSEEQMGEINPLFILNKHKERFLFNFSKKNKSRSTHSIEIRTRDENAEFKKIIIVVNKLTDEIVSIRQDNKDGVSLFIEFLKFEDKIKLSNTDFVFDKSKYKDVYENDLR